LGSQKRPIPEMLLSRAEAALAEAKVLVQPAAIWAEMEAAGLAKLLLPGIPAEHISGVHTLIAAVCTIGALLETQAARAFARQEFSHAYLLDQIGALAVSRLAGHVESLLRAGRNAARWAPGDGEEDWAIEAQRMLFALLPAEAIGVYLTEQNVMVPAKSLSFVLLVGGGPEGRQCLGRCSGCVWNGACERQRTRQ